MLFISCRGEHLNEGVLEIFHATFGLRVLEATVDFVDDEQLVHGTAELGGS